MPQEKNWKIEEQSVVSVSGCAQFEKWKKINPDSAARFSRHSNTKTKKKKNDDLLLIMYIISTDGDIEEEKTQKEMRVLESFLKTLILHTWLELFCHFGSSN